MKVLNLKNIALGAAVVLTLGFGVNNANAQTSATFGTSFVTEPGLQATAGTDLDFGSWVVFLNGGDTPTITQAAPIPGGGPSAGTVADNGDANTIVTNVTPPSTAGTIDVDSAIASDVRVRAVVTDFTEDDVALSAITASDDAGNTNIALTNAFVGTTVLNIDTGGATETFTFGGQLHLGADTGAVPEDTTFASATVEVFFAY